MRYRDARLLKEGDKVVTKETNITYMVRNVEVYGSERPIRVNVVSDSGEKLAFFHTELKDNEG